MSAPAPDDGVLLLLALASPALPTGAFAYSHGLEWAFESGAARDFASLMDWMTDLLDHGAARSDVILARCAFDAARSRDGAELSRLGELALALSPSRERRLETGAQGAALLKIARAAWPCAALDGFTDENAAAPVVFGALAAGRGAPLGAALQAFLFSFTANLLSAAVRLGLIGQTDGQRATAALQAPIAALAARAQTMGLDDLGGAAFGWDIASMRHERQYSRLFRS